VRNPHNKLKKTATTKKERYRRSRQKTKIVIVIIDCQCIMYIIHEMTMIMCAFYAGVFKDIGPWMYDILIDLRGVKELYGISVSSTGRSLLTDK
jgi:hypothetical protein